MSKLVIFLRQPLVLAGTRSSTAHTTTVWSGGREEGGGSDDRSYSYIKPWLERGLRPPIRLRPGRVGEWGGTVNATGRTHTSTSGIGWNSLFDRPYDYGLIISLRSFSSKLFHFIDQIIEELGSGEILLTPSLDRLRGALKTKYLSFRIHSVAPENTAKRFVNDFQKYILLLQVNLSKTGSSSRLIHSLLVRDY